MPSSSVLKAAAAAVLALLGQSLAAPSVLSATATFSSTPSATVSLVSNTYISPHASYTGTPTTTGALSTSVLAPSISPRPAANGSSSYPADGRLHAALAAPYLPSGGEGTNGSAPVYRPMSDYDYQALSLALYQAWAELDLLRYGLAEYPQSEFYRHGLTPTDRYLLRFMAEQQVGHATLLTNVLGPGAPRPCAYNYPLTDNLTEYIDFSQKLFKWGESSIYGFVNHLNSRAAGQLLTQSTAIKARQQMLLRQFAGLFPMPVWFEPGIPRLLVVDPVGANFPALHIINQPNPARINGSDAANETTGAPANALNATALKKAGESSTPLSYPGRQVFLRWDAPGIKVGPNNSYVTSTTAKQPRFALWVGQLNATYTPLHNVRNNTADYVPAECHRVCGGSRR
ncbi:hypothetical protein ACRE_067700 [Hapsidospora chrysogenum ATCC 11550]|uniref:Uncharacterized protein n=1 Tax=Hapsidospora chrysogenum (strain ATCC 11550 / CBS 779.69 / DSM 880 / IAM 14645 / JCM 23072 / IMI 49137) TaxID=857340 RepID=A0A086SZG7_HAPC1|nr:hypothetical protein ACRE_067700 [Hapsidospora chrysogenum ATCC 11550]